MTTQWGLPKPNLVLSVAGGVGRSKVKTWVREVLRQGLVRAAQSTGKRVLPFNLDLITFTMLYSLYLAVKEVLLFVQVATCSALQITQSVISDSALMQEYHVLRR